MKFSSPFIAVGFLVLGTGVAPAQDLPQTSEAALYSITRGFRQTSLPLLQRLGTREPDAVSAALVEKLCPAPCANLNRRAAGTKLEVASGDWSVQVIGDGTAARYENIEVGKRLHSTGRDPSQKTSSEALERAGRAYIEANLASVITLGLDEQIVPTRIDYRFEAGLDLGTQQTTRAVVANRIVFGRTIRGVPVVGGGARVVLTFANDGALESFQYDWPQYQVGSPRSVVAHADILDRVQAVIGDRMGVPTSPTTRVSKSQGPTYTVELMQNTVLQNLECGYYDPGVLSREATAPVQPGCVYHVVHQSDNGKRAGFAGAVPAAAQIEPDPGWREAIFLRGPGPSQQPLVPGPSRAQ
jgi:hypothetical protein